MKWLPRLKKLDWIIIFTLVIGYFLIVTRGLTRLPIFVDEALYLRWAQIAWHDASWRFISLTDGKQPLYVWFVIPFLKLIDDPLYAGRLASGVCGLFSMLGMGYLGYLLGNKKTALLAMLVTMFSPYLFFYYRFGVMESMLVAGSLWVCNLSILLARSRRLDVAMILGMVTGATILVKSSGMFFLLLIPAAYLLDFDHKKLFTKSTLKYLGLVLVAWIIAGVMYNVQRLSPWMHMIGQKNAFFIVPYSEIFNEVARLTNNFLDVWRWQIGYTTIPMLILAVSGIYLMIKADVRKFLFLAAWLLAPMMGTVLLARLFAPRYAIFVTPFILYFAAYALSVIKNTKHLLVVLFAVTLLPISLITRLITDPINYPYVSVDEGYVNGWSAGNGTKQIADWTLNRMRETGQPMTIFTEGTFGILPHGLELYVDGRIPGMTITGLYPITDIPPSHAIESVKTNPETYLVLNNTQTSSQLPGLELVGEYHKFDPLYTMRLYRVLPVTK
jgi:4-amino-4-deoxy-L-arabinose transferase-like glycosyltransferase